MAEIVSVKSYLLRIEGIRGGSKNPAHRGWISVDQYWDRTLDRTSRNTKPSDLELVLTMPANEPALPLIFQSPEKGGLMGAGEFAALLSSGWSEQILSFESC